MASRGLADESQCPHVLAKYVKYLHYYLKQTPSMASTRQLVAKIKLHNVAQEKIGR